MRTMNSLRGLWRHALVLATVLLASCGGPGGETTTATKTEKLTLTIDNSTLVVGAPATVTAVLTDGAGTIKSGQTITFKTDSNYGVMTPASGVWTTDSTGTAKITLASGPNIGSSTITATTAQGTSASLSYTNSTVGRTVSSIQLLVSSGSLLADGSSTVDLTALVKDVNNNTVSGQTVSFTSDSGAVTTANGGVSDASGRATATLSSGGDRSNRTITVTASAGGVKSTATVSVTGTRVSVAGVSSVVLGNKTNLTIRLQDGAGKAIGNQTVTLGSSLGNTFTVNGSTSTSVTTDTSGQATVTYNATKAGTDNVTAAALNQQGVLVINVSNDAFTLVAPAQGGVNFPAGSNPEFALNTAITIKAQYLVGTTPQAGKTVNLTTTRGKLASSTLTTDGNGEAFTTISADTAGGAIITATSGGATAQYSVEFVSVSPNKIALIAEKSTISPKGNTSITATVRDAKNNLVKNQNVTFTLSDSTGGSLSVANGLTDSSGQTSTTYTAGSSSSAKDGVVVTATVAGTALTSNVKLTIAGQSLFVRIGTGNQIAAPNTTQYSMPYSVLVTDAAGNPVSGATVSFSIVPNYYRKGFHYFAFGAWQPVSQLVGYTTSNPACDADSVQTGSSGTPAVLSCLRLVSPLVCANEDSFVDTTNGIGANNGILEAGEDINGNGTLEPGFVASVTPSVVTDATGSGFITIVYPKDRSDWVNVTLNARVTVQGTEASTSATFTLTGLAADFTSATVSPPGAISPYGQATVLQGGCSNPL